MARPMAVLRARARPVADTTLAVGIFMVVLSVSGESKNGLVAQRWRSIPLDASPSKQETRLPAWRYRVARKFCACGREFIRD
ncbi:hypothetical protein D3C80_1973860 [compost metagenome]